MDVPSLVQMSVQGALMVVAVAALRSLLLNRLPKKAFLLLWALVVLRLLVPLNVPSPVSVHGLVERLAPASSQQAVGTADGGAVGQDTTLAAGASGVRENAGLDGTASVASPAEKGSSEGAQEASPAGPLAALAGLASLGAPFWGTAWAGGTLACLAWFSLSYIRCRREFRSSLPVDNALVADWLEAHQLRRPIDIRQTDRISAPLTYGVLRPVILVPATMDWDDADALRYVLEHEFTHIRRLDAASKLALAAAACVHWFNPLAWTMYVLANRDIEIACDETVVRGFGRTSRGAYARALIKMEETRNVRAPLCNGFGATAIEERIVAIMSIRKTSVAAVVASVALVVGVPAAFATTSAWDTGSGVVVQVDSSQGESAGDEGDATLPATVEPAAPEESAFDSGAGGDDAADDRQYLAYAPYGVTYDDASGILSYQGETVRYFWDGIELADGSLETYGLYYNPNGTVDLGTVRNADADADTVDLADPAQTELTGVTELTYVQLAEISSIMDGTAYVVRVDYAVFSDASEDAEATVISPVVEESGDETAADSGQTAHEDVSGAGAYAAELLAPFARYGVAFETGDVNGMGNVYYNGELVHTFVDYNETTGGMFAFTSDDADGSSLNLRTVYDADGNVTGVRPFSGTILF